MSTPEMTQSDEGAPEVGSRIPESGLPAHSRESSRVSVALAAGLVAGLLAWLGGEAIVALKTADQTFVPANQGQIAQHDALIQQATIFKSTASFAILGAAVGLAMGIAGGWLRHSSSSSLTTGIAAAILGALVTAGVAWVSLPMFLKDTEQLGESMLAPILMHGLLWAPVGLVGGLAFAIGLGRPPAMLLQGAIAGVIGAVFGATIYDIVGALVLTSENTAMPLSEGWGSRLLARMCVAVLVGLITAAVLDPRSNATSRATPIPTPD
ncbi:hypothetical protein [Tautonia rosea]|uniref:hypothetical protein n=1 Tax=Tautonia rosea TaxID=2728037 RepID=UPI00147542F9|nr:hypothetical protein [Tautonia rosea]